MLYSTLVILFCATTQVLGLRKIACLLEDVDCMTRGTKTLYPKIVAGRPDIGMPTLEPIHVALIEAKTPTLNYTSSNTYLHGMKDCRPGKLQFVQKNLTWYFYLFCPHFEVESNYYINGDIDDIHTEGEGKCRIVYDSYHIGILGNMDRYMDAEGKVHVNTTSFVLIELDVQGSVTYNFENLFYGNEGKNESVNNIIHEKFGIIIQEPMMNAFIGKFVDNINTYVKAVSMNDIFYKYV